MKTIYLLLLLFISISCVPELNIQEEPFSPKIIVEGSIENGKYPVVYLRETIPFFTQITEETFKEKIIRDAKVCISDGEREEILTAHYQKEYPYHSYKGHEIKGECGKTYYLTIIYRHDTLTAQTTIPPTVPILSSEMEARNDTINQLFIHFKHTPSPRIANYRIFTFDPSLNQEYIPSLSILNLSNLPEGEVKIPVLKGIDKMGKDSIDIFFHKDQQVFIKFCTIDSISNLFWESFNNENLADINLLTGSATELRSNVSPPAIGIWCGYGSCYYQAQ